MTNGSIRRRSVLHSGFASILLLSLAGCLDSDDEETEEEDDTGDDPVDMDAIDDHLADANGYDGDLQDHRGEDTLAIDVGDPDGGNDYRFDPVAPEIDTGTTVEWTWVDDGTHSVSHEADDPAFDSDAQEDYEFEHTFDEAGTFLYYCGPHRAQGHLGAIVVH